MSAEHVEIGRPKHPGEARGIRIVVDALPENFVVYSNVDLATGRRAGHTFEHDLLILAPHAVFTVELKSWGGRITGNRDRWTLEDGTIVQSPIPLVAEKARVLKGVLTTRSRALQDVWVQGLVLVTGVDAQPFLSADYKHFVATPKTIAKALTDPSIWGLSGRKLDEVQKSTVLRVFSDGTPVSAPTHIGQHFLLQRLPSENRGFDVWLAKAPLGEHRVLHVYPIRGDNEKARKRAHEHALREATLQARLKGGPDLLEYCEYEIVEHPHSIVLRFEDTTRYVTARTWIEEQKPGLLDRLRMARRMANALTWVHDRDVVHRRLSIQAFLVSPEPTPTHVKLTELELARDMQGRAPTVSSSALEDPSYRCMAPELVRAGEATRQSDLFSLGATLFELFTGRALFQRPEDVLRPVELPAIYVGDKPLPPEITRLVAALIATSAADRPEKASDVVRVLDEVLARAAIPALPGREGLQPGDCIRDVYRLEKHLGEGASGSSWLVIHTLDGSKLVAKIADADKAELLRNEADVLRNVYHPNLVRYRSLEPLDGGNVLLLSYTEGDDGREWAGAGAPVTPAQLEGLGVGLFGAIGALHAEGWLHRDIKPENVILAATDLRPTLIDLGLARQAGEEGELTVGSIPYKDPLLWHEMKWSAANDLFAGWLVLYEILTGVHPFDHRPESSKRPRIDTSLLDSFPEAVADRLGALFADALSPDPGPRPKTAEEAIARLRAVFTEAAPPAPEKRRPKPPLPGMPEPQPLPADLSLDGSILSLNLSTRATTALERLGVSTVRQVLGVEERHLKVLPNVGRKTRTEVLDLVKLLAARFPEVAPAPPVPAPTIFYPALLPDTRSLTELGAALTDRVRSSLEKQGVVSVGDLCALPEGSLKKVPGIGPHKIKALRDALRALAGEGDRPETLAQLGQAIEKEIGSDFNILRLRCGFVDGVVASMAECADRLGVTRQRISQAYDIEPLRAAASAAAWLVSTVNDLLPRAGFAPLESLANALHAAYPPGEGASALGYARLAAILLEPGRRLTGIEDIEFVFRPPWTPEAILALRDALSAKANWPPVPRAEAEAFLWDQLPAETQGALRRWGADPAALLAATAPLCPSIERTLDESLFTPPVMFADALKVLKPRLPSGIGENALMEALRQEFKAVSAPQNLHAELRAFGLESRGGVVVDAKDERETPPAVLAVDPDIPRQRVQPTGPIDVNDLIAAASRGGFRVVGLPLGKHHLFCEQLAAGLSAALGPERVRFVDVDRVILESLQDDADRWADALFEDGKKDPRWGFARELVQAGLESSVLGTTSTAPLARPGIVTVLGRPSLLGPLGLLPWLGGLYERARGGRYGLLVLALPGVVRDGRVRLNDQYSLPYTPDMAAVCLVDEQVA